MIYEIEEKVHTDSILDVLVKTKKFIELTSSKLLVSDKKLS